MGMDGDIAKVERPCPFCACTTIKHRDDGETGWLECDWCGATGPYSSEDAAAELSVEQAWNKRILADRPYKIDGCPVSRQEVLDQAHMISGKPVRTLTVAKQILADDGREVTGPVPEANDA